jgi:hypothetical protein
MFNTELSFTVDGPSRRALSALRRAVGASSDAEVIRRALTLLSLATQNAQAGGKLVLRDAQGAETEVIILR